MGPPRKPGANRPNPLKPGLAQPKASALGPSAGPPRRAPAPPPVYYPPLALKVFQPKRAEDQQPVKPVAAERKAVPPPPVYDPGRKSIAQAKPAVGVPLKRIPIAAQRAKIIQPAAASASALRGSRKLEKFLRDVWRGPEGSPDRWFSQIACILKDTEFEGRAHEAVEFYRRHPELIVIPKSAMDIVETYNPRKACVLQSLIYVKGTVWGCSSASALHNEIWTNHSEYRQYSEDAVADSLYAAAGLTKLEDCEGMTMGDMQEVYSAGRYLVMFRGSGEDHMVILDNGNYIEYNQLGGSGFQAARISKGSLVGAVYGA